LCGVKPSGPCKQLRRAVFLTGMNVDSRRAERRVCLRFDVLRGLLIDTGIWDGMDRKRCQLFTSGACGPFIPGAGR
jgi:hypothetical protein